MAMGEDIIPFFGEVKDQMQGIIKVVGVGDGGFGPYLVQAPEGDHAPKGSGGQGVRGKVVKF